MAIAKIGVLTDPPAVGDYTRIIAHLNAFARQVSGNQFILTQTAGTGLPALALGAYIQHGGVVYQVQTADEVISGTPADGTYYIKVAASSDVLVATWITDISGYTWNAVYNCLTASDESQLLPYMVVVSGSATVYTKYRLDIKAIDSIGYWTDQRLRTVDSPQFGDLIVRDNYVVAGDENFYGLATETSASTSSPYNAFDKSIVCPNDGSFRCVASIISGYFSASVFAYMSFVVYKNGSEVYRYDQAVANTYETKTYDVSFVTGDIIRHRVYLRSIGGGGPYAPYKGKDMFFNGNHVKNSASLYDNMYVFY